MRLAYYLLYAQIDDEDTIVYLFQEELKDRKSNSFQGIGNTLNVLTSILKRYNDDGRYNEMLEEAKNANFDCACGYDKNYWIDDEIDSLDLMDCIFLSQDYLKLSVVEPRIPLNYGNGRNHICRKEQICMETYIRKVLRQHK